MALPTLVYDGDCGFCTTSARFVERRVPTPAAVVPWQRADLAALGLTAGECQEAVQWADGRGGTAAGPDAFAGLFLSARSRWWRAAGRVLRLRPVRALAWPAYRWVARHRDRLPGGTAACAMPPSGAAGPAPGDGAGA
jgi:predicted DCC family thiol-disulfide oxidoreductase YuxK